MNLIKRVNAKVYDSKGHCIYSNEEESNSLLGNFISVLFNIWQESNYGITDASNVTVYDYLHTVCTRAGGNLNMEGTAGQDFRGLVIGTGNTPNTIDTYTLAAKIANGVTPGKMTHGPQSYVGPQAGGAGINPRTFSFQRTFTNSSGGAIVINEIGLFGFNGSAQTICIERSVITPFNVPNLGAATIVWTLGVQI